MSTILTGYEDDFAKYKRRLAIAQIQEPFRSTALQVGKKFVYSHAYRDANSKFVPRALDLLLRAGVVHKVCHTNANDGAVLASERDVQRFITLPHDLGVFHRLCGLSIDDLAVADPLALIHKGRLAEAACGLELLWQRPPYSLEPLYYWHREAKSSKAEVDYVVSVGGQFVPVEVKATWKGAMHSMRAFLRAKAALLGVRVSTENFGRLKDALIVPLYAVSEIARLVSGAR